MLEVQAQRENWVGRHGWCCDDIVRLRGGRGAVHAGSWRIGRKYCVFESCMESTTPAYLTSM
jgi:hypothetical protein